MIALEKSNKTKQNETKTSIFGKSTAVKINLFHHHHHHQNNARSYAKVQITKFNHLFILSFYDVAVFALK